MKLSDLIQAVSPTAERDTASLEIQGLYFDSRMVQPGGLFFALKGSAADGHRFIGLAAERGAVAAVVEEADAVPTGFPFVQVADSRLAMAQIAAAFYGNPTAGIPVVGITGTNGKTTTSYIVEGILAAAGIPAAVLGTVSYRLADTEFPASHTTPESAELQAMLRTLVDKGAAGAVMEVSSHALEQRRVDGCSFDAGIFTNLTRDHLDYHGSMEQYLEAKLRLFRELLKPTADKPNRCAAVNLDDPQGATVTAAAACRVVTYAVHGKADVQAVNIRSSISGIAGELVTPSGSLPFVSKLVGSFNLANILAAVAAGHGMGLPLEDIRKGVEEHRTVPGRLERVENRHGIGVFVDYAHTGDALENVLQTLAELKTARIICVFGCGGDRDRGKRPIMGEIAGRLSDLAIITSDNPRTENPDAIIAEVRSGVLPLGLREYAPGELASGLPGKGFTVVPDRRAAIRLAVTLAQRDDIVLLAGKGHEDYQIIGTVKHHFDDREEAAQALAERGDKG